MAASLYSPDAIAVANLAELIPLTADATVTKTLYDSPTARLVLFAMDAGQRLTDHSAAKPALVQVLEGGIEFEVGGQTHKLGPSGWVAMPAGEVHAVLATQPSRFLLTLLKGGA
jgi:quercetin dioxygenase-like cupin family protein